MLRRQLKEQPRTHEGGFWHKRIYPYQMWLDGLYMAEPFYASYALQCNEAEAFDDIADQFVYVYRHTRDSVMGLAIMDGMKAGPSSGRILPPAAPPVSGDARWDGT